MSATSTDIAPTEVGSIARAGDEGAGGALESGAVGRVRMQESTKGLLYALAAYISWGLAPLYFKAVAFAPALEVLAHRVIWAAPLLALLVTARGGWPSLRQAVRTARTMRTLCVTTLLIGANWYVFIWAVASGRALEASLGYFINPLVNVALGVIFFKDRPTRPQLGGIVLAALGVAYLAWEHEGLPWVSMFLAVSFGFYGLLRKRASVDAITGLTIETCLLLPLGVAYAAWILLRGESAFGSGSIGQAGLLMLAGVVTMLPLLWFTEAARRIRLLTLGFLQYIAPTGQFFLAVLVFGEAFTRAHAVAFSCIWAALVIYSVDLTLGARRTRRARRMAAAPPAP